MWSIKRSVRPAPAALVLATGVCLLALAGCKSGPYSPGKPEVANAPNPLEQYTVKVKETPERLALSVHASGLSDKQQAALLAFAQQWHESGAEAITVESPINSAEDGDPKATASRVTAALAVMGVPADRVRRIDYDAGGVAKAPVVAHYDRLEAVGPNCTGHWGNLVATNSNDVSSHFGCATTANFAVMLADPRDLARPAAAQPADGPRRAVVLDKYRQGLVTSSAKDDQASGAISQAVH